MGLSKSDIKRDVFGDMTSVYTRGPANGVLGTEYNAASAYDWENGNLSMNLAIPEKMPMDCADKCREAETKTRENCQIIIKRVKQSLKDAGCDVEIKLKPRKGCGYRSRKATSTSSRARQVASRRGRR